MSSIATAFLFVIVAMAGCSGGDDDAGTALLTPQSGDGSATLTILVVDQSILPIEDASVAVPEIEDAIGTTDGDGRAVFTGLEPGTYQVFVQKLGYESVGRSMTVQANEEATMQVELGTLRVSGIYHEVFPHVGHMACGGGLVAVTFTGGCPSDNHRVTWDTEVTKELVTILGELQWTQTSSFSAKELQLAAGQDESCNPCSFEHSYGGETGPSPVILRSDGPFDGIPEDSERGEVFEIRHRIWVPGSSPDPPVVIVVLEQPVEIWVTAFYGGPMADDYTALPDA